MTIKSEDRMCKLTCKSFSCSKRMFTIKQDKGKKSFICRLDDSECLGYMCSYADCRERKLGDSGECLRPVKVEQIPRSKNPKGQFPSYAYRTNSNADQKFRKN